MRVPRLAPAQMAELTAFGRGWSGPCEGRGGALAQQDLQRRIAKAFGVDVHERTVGKYLAALGLRRLQVAPAAPENRPGRARGVQKNFRAAVEVAIPETAQGRPLEIWFQGEPGQKTVRGTVFPVNARVGQQGTLMRM